MTRTTSGGSDTLGHEPENLLNAMFRKLLLLLVPFLFTIASFAQQAWLPGEVLILLKKGATIHTVEQELLRKLPVGAKLKAAEPLGRTARYQKLVLEQTGTDDRELEKRIARLPGVEATSLNYLVTLPEVNKAQIGITGHSRNGKMALLAAAFDERIGAAVPSSNATSMAARVGSPISAAISARAYMRARPIYAGRRADASAAAKPSARRAG